MLRNVLSVTLFAFSLCLACSATTVLAAESNDQASEISQCSKGECAASCEKNTCKAAVCSGDRCSASACEDGSCAAKTCSSDTCSAKTMFGQRVLRKGLFLSRQHACHSSRFQC